MGNKSEMQQLKQLGYQNVSYQDQDAHATYYDAMCNCEEVELKIVNENQHENINKELWERPMNTEDWFYIENFK